MPAENNNLIKKVVKITPELQEMLTISRKKLGILNESEAIRQAISSWYRREVTPPYREPSPRQKEKQMEMETQKHMENMDPEDYATDVMGARVFTSKNGKKYAVMMAIANSIKIIPIESVKDVDSQDEFFKNTHFNLLAEGKDFDVYLKRGARKLEAVGIYLDEENGNQNTNQNQWNEKENPQKTSETG